MHSPSDLKGVKGLRASSSVELMSLENTLHTHKEDEILAKAVVLPIFGLMTTKRRKLPDKIIVMELGSIAAIWPEGLSRS